MVPANTLKNSQLDIADIDLAAKLMRVTRDTAERPAAVGVANFVVRLVEHFDHVIFACHADQALSLLGED